MLSHLAKLKASELSRTRPMMTRTKSTLKKKSRKNNKKTNMNENKRRIKQSRPNLTKLQKLNERRISPRMSQLGRGRAPRRSPISK